MIESLLLNLESHDVVTEQEQALLRSLISRDRRFKVDEDIVPEGSRPGYSTLSRLVLPIGGTAVHDKRPAVIAALAVAEIVTALARYRVSFES